jgi:chromosome segregation ATPase
MPKINFKLSDSEKLDAIWALLNPEFNEEGNWTVSCSVFAVYDDYALVYNYETAEYQRAYYTKNDETNMVELNNMVKCYIVDVTEQEMNTLNTLRALNGDTYELVSDVLTNAQENSDKVSEFSTKIEELNNTITTLNSEKAEVDARVNEYTAQIEAANNTIASLNEDLSSLEQYKKGIETN